MDNLTKEQRHKNMKKIRSQNTTIEIMLRKALWSHGFRYRKNCKDLPGKPDIVITKSKIAIFCDSEFFHGKNWEALKIKIENGDNKEYWLKKISRNIEHDSEINKQLSILGWTVQRFWGNDIKKNISECVRIIEKLVFNSQNMRNN